MHDTRAGWGRLAGVAYVCGVYALEQLSIRIPENSSLKSGPPTHSATRNLACCGGMSAVCERGECALSGGKTRRLESNARALILVANDSRPQCTCGCLRGHGEFSQQARGAHLRLARRSTQLGAHPRHPEQ